MPHALIIDQNNAVSRAIRQYLGRLGFASFDTTCTEHQAIVAAQHRRPDLIVIGDDIEMGCALRAARLISAEGAVPVLMVSGDPARASERLKMAKAYSGPFRINQIEEAVDIALRARPHRPAANMPAAE